MHACVRWDYKFSSPITASESFNGGLRCSRFIEASSCFVTVLVDVINLTEMFMLSYVSVYFSLVVHQSDSWMDILTCIREGAKKIRYCNDK